MTHTRSLLGTFAGGIGLLFAEPAFAQDLVITCYVREAAVPAAVDKNGDVSTVGDRRLLVLQFPIQIGRHETDKAKYFDPTNMLLGRKISATRIEGNAIGIETVAGPHNDYVTVALGPPVGEKHISTAFISHAGGAMKNSRSYIGPCEPVVPKNPDEAFATLSKLPVTQK